ncbi:MAG: Mpv17/PMP22 family protein [Lentimicrobium sp.]|nr:Mpv17/PMP22 family protein [Lentimicrobium sp.]
MKRSDLIFICCVVLFFLPFFVSDYVYETYNAFNQEHGMIMSFLKFAILATLGEVIGLRIKTGKYNAPGFGILPRALVWGFLGLTIKLAFVIFSSGTVSFLSYMGLENAGAALKGSFSLQKLFVAFCISVFMNTMYAPVMMTLHKITDTHILSTGGTLRGLFTPIEFGGIISKLNWNVQWNFVFKKTIPFFWFPAHTITFLLPVDYQVLFAAVLGIALGTILALASMKK